MHVCVSFYISIFELSLCIYIFISVSILLDSHSGLPSNSKPGRPNGIDFRGFLLAALGGTGHTWPADNQSINEGKHSLSCRSSSRPPSSSPSDKTVWIKLPPIVAIQADPHHSFPPEVASSSWSWPLVVLSRTHFFIPALWLLLLIKKKKKRKLSRFEIQEKKIEANWKMFLSEKSGQPDDSVEIWAMKIPCKVTLQRCGNLIGGEDQPQSEVNCLSLRNSQNPSTSAFGRSHKGTSWTFLCPVWWGRLY